MSSLPNAQAGNYIVEEDVRNGEDGGNAIELDEFLRYNVSNVADDIVVDLTNCSSEDEENNVSNVAGDTLVDLTNCSSDEEDNVSNVDSEEEEDEEEIENFKENDINDLVQEDQDVAEDWTSDSTSESKYEGYEGDIENFQVDDNYDSAQEDQDVDTLEDLEDEGYEGDIENFQENDNYDSAQEDQDEHVDHRLQRHYFRRFLANENLNPVINEEIIFDPTVPNDLQLMEHEIVSLADFEKLKVLGTGAYGKVLLVRKLNGFDSGKLYAMKIIPKLKKMMTKITKLERIALEKVIDLPFIVNLQYAFQTDLRLYLVLDYVNGGDFFTHFYDNNNNLTEELIKFYIAELILAIEQLHERNIIYGDVKLENILLDRDGHIVLTDFGFATILPHSEATITTFCGTPQYMAPEKFRKQEYGLEIDWWSVGVLCVELCTGRSAFIDNEEDITLEELTARIENDDPYIGHTMQGAARNFASQLLIKDTTLRLGCREGASELKRHSFFRDINWDDLYNQRTKPSMIPQIRHELDVSNFSEELTLMPTEDERIDRSEYVDIFFRGFEYVNPHILRLMRYRTSAYDLEDNDWRTNHDEMTEEEQTETDDEEFEVEEIIELDDEGEIEEIIEFDEEEENEEYETSELTTEPYMNCSRSIHYNLWRLVNTEPQSPFFLKYHLNINKIIELGDFSICMMCSDRQTQKQFAVKILNINDGSKNEVNFLRAFKENKRTKNTYIVQYHEYLKDNYFMYIVMEPLRGKSLLERIRKEKIITEKKACNYFKQIALGVRHMHSVNCVHGHLLPNNIIFKDVGGQELKIIDFSFATLPATFNDDIRSLGDILYIMLFGGKPLLSMQLEINEFHKAIGERSKIYSNLSGEVKNLLCCLATKYCKESFDIKAVLEHAWLKKSDLQIPKPFNMLNRNKKRHNSEPIQQPIKQVRKF